MPDFGKAIRFFQFGYRAYRPRIAEEKFHYRERRNRLLRGPCRLLQENLGFKGSHTALVSSGTGLLIMRDNRLYKAFDSMGYIFGMTVIGDRVYLLHLVQVEGNYKHSEETYRRSEIYSARIEDLKALEPGQHLDIRREHTEKRVLFSQCNSHGGKLYVVDYLGRLSVYGINDDGTLDHDHARHVMVNRHFNGAPLRYYAYTHFNCVSVSGDKVVLGAHGRKAHSGQFSGFFTIDLDLDPESIAYVPTPFVHAHDMLVAGQDIVACDSRNGVLVRNGEKLHVDAAGFMRGLSITAEGYLVGISVKSDRRSDRNKETTGGNHIIELAADGSVLSRASLLGSQIYDILELERPDLTVSQFADTPGQTTCPDLAKVLGQSAARDTATYYDGEDPPFHGTIKDY
jgi:hypothetical protein